MKIRGKAFAVGCAAAVLLTSLSFIGASASVKPSKAITTKPVTLTMWWWGDQEAPGAQAWVDETVKAYQKKRPNVTIKTVLQTTDGLVPAFAAAAAAKSGPDLQYFWGGIYAQQPGWDGQITPVSDLIPADELKHYINATTELSFQGKIWTAPWYVNPSFPVLARTDVLSKYKLKVPTTWKDLLNVCDVLSAKGVPALAGGVKDGWFGGWLYSIIGGQSVSSSKDVVAAVVGKQKFTDAMHADWWTRLQETKEHKCWNSDINSLELYQAQQLWKDGKAAMTVVAGPDAPNFANAVGASKVVVMAMPKWSNGKFAGKMGSTSQTIGITQWSKNKEVAADFLMFSHEKAQLNNWFKLTGSMPADDRFDLNSVKDPVKKALFQSALPGAPYLENFIPAQLDADAVFANVQLVLAGTKTGKAAAADMQAVMERLRKTDRNLVKNFTAWSK
jgi:raffinose/stachyose/melibiose transport system substrate-binding protein